MNGLRLYQPRMAETMIQGLGLLQRQKEAEQQEAYRQQALEQQRIRTEVDTLAALLKIENDPVKQAQIVNRYFVGLLFIFCIL